MRNRILLLTASLLIPLLATQLAPGASLTWTTSILSQSDGCGIGDNITQKWLSPASTWSNANPDSATFGGSPSSPTYSLTKDGAGTLKLSGANTYTGTTTLAAGVLNLNVGETSGPTRPAPARASARATADCWATA